MRNFLFNLLLLHFTITIIELLSLQLKDGYILLNDIIQVINFFVLSQSYTIVKKYIKINKKGVIYKTVLIYNYSKVYAIKY